MTWSKALRETFEELAGEARTTARRHFTDAATSVLVSLLSILTASLVSLAKSESEQRPWQTLWIAVPSGALLWLLLQSPAGRTLTRPRGLVLGVFLVFAAVASGTTFTRLLDWRRPDIGHHADPLRFVRHPGWGDWRYRAVAPQERDPRLVIVAVKKQEGADEAVERSFRRDDIHRVVQYAIDNDAIGIALDYRFSETSPMDAGLVAAIADAHTRMPVVSGMDLEPSQAGDLDRRPLPVTFRSALPESCLGHTLSFLSADTTVRSLPAFAGDHPLRPALSVLAAARIEGRPIGAMKLPPDGEIGFLRPKDPFSIIPAESLMLGAPQWRDRLRDRFVFIGEDSQAERRKTPWGVHLGVEVQAWAANSLLLGHTVQHDTWWVSAFAIWAALYWLASLAQSRKSVRTILWWAVAIALVCFLFAAAAIRANLYWVDITYVMPVLVSFVAVIAISRGWRPVNNRVPRTPPTA